MQQNEENISTLLWHLNSLFEAHHHSCDDTTTAAFEALHALGFYAGCIMAQAKDSETKQAAHRVFMGAIQDALNSNDVTKH